MITESNNCVQATPVCALLFIVAQVSGAACSVLGGSRVTLRRQHGPTFV